jgi:hypothetical protein
MSIGRRCLVVVVLLLIPTAARAHDHVADFFGAFCYAHASNLAGVQQSLAIALPFWEKDISFVTDTSFHVGKHDGEPLTRVSYLLGLRYTPTGMQHPSHLFSVHGLVGGVRDGGLNTNNDWAVALGGGYEYLLDGNPEGWGFRTQVDYVISGGENFPRISGGIVFRR